MPTFKNVPSTFFLQYISIEKRVDGRFKKIAYGTKIIIFCNHVFKITPFNVIFLKS